jgi:hypothetical protein
LKRERFVETPPASHSERPRAMKNPGPFFTEGDSSLRWK